MDIQNIIQRQCAPGTRIAGVSVSNQEYDVTVCNSRIAASDSTASDSALKSLRILPVLAKMDVMLEAMEVAEQRQAATRRGA